MKLEITSTIWEHAKQHTEQKTCYFEADPFCEKQIVNLYPDMTYQKVLGFGGAATEAAGYVYSKMSAADRLKTLEAYFGESGNHYRLVRVSIDSCDFSLDLYEAMSDAGDKDLLSFSLARDERYILPFLRDAQRYAKEPLHLLLSPWSPPAFMKTNGERCHGGKLKPDYYLMWAQYLCCYLKAYRQEGFCVDYLTIQNEAHAVQTWDSCTYSSEEEKGFLRDYLYPELVKHGLSDIKVLVWDHNKEYLLNRMNEMIDQETDSMIAGAAFHWYSGDHFESLSLVRDKYPDKELIFTEGCVEFSKFSSDAYLDNARMYAHDLIGNFNGGMNGFCDWNMILDGEGGPNHAGNFCAAPVMYDVESQTLDIRLEHTYIRHFSHYIDPGALRIGYTKYTDQFELCAFLNPNQTIVAVVLNRTDRDLPVTFKLTGETASWMLKRNSISTCLIAGSHGNGIIRRLR